MLNVFNIESHLPFAETLATGILQKYRGDSLPDIRVFLPNARAKRSLTDAFLKITNGKPIILPRLHSLGDIASESTDFEESLQYGNDFTANFTTPANKILPAISLHKRSMLLAYLVQKFGHFDKNLPPASAYVLGQALGRFLDMMQIVGVELSCLEELCAEDYANHWQTILQFLLILKDHWSAILQAHKVEDIATHQNRKLEFFAECLKSGKDSGAPLIIAGTTGSRFWVRRLSRVVGSLPYGSVVLPGVDTYCDDEAWEACGHDACHPQYGLHHMLAEIGVKRSDLRNWHSASLDSSGRERSRFLSWLMQSGWRGSEDSVKSSPSAVPLLRDYSGNLAVALANVRRFDCENETEEARIIAYHMRKTLETPGKTAALVTPSRRLSLKVAAELKRWQIDVEVTAGGLLSLSPLGQYLKLVADVCASGLRPIKLLGLLQHSFSLCGKEEGEFKRLTGLLERYVLRGQKPDNGFAGLRKKLHEKASIVYDGKAIIPPAVIKELQSFIDELESRLSPLFQYHAQQQKKASDFLRVHLQAAESFADSPFNAGAERLWRGEEGVQAARLLREFLLESEILEAFPLSDYPLYFARLLDGVTLSKAYGMHSRLFIWGALEARLQRADVMILGGLDEEIWPPALPSDAWMSPSMRLRCGLPPLEQRVGLSAHDFAQAFASPEVILTRARKRNGSPMTASRWLERLSAAQIGHKHKNLQDGNFASSDEKSHWRLLLHGDGSGASTIFERARACPAVDARPRRLSVTQFGVWCKDPYAIYASKVLNLHALPAIEKPEEHTLKGNIIHRVLEDYIQEGVDGDRDYCLRRFRFIANEHLANASTSPVEEKLLRHKLDFIGCWFIDKNLAQREQIVRSQVEDSGRMQLSEVNWEITAKPDRIDYRLDESCDIIDYKSGTTASIAAIVSGREPQLSLEAWMAEAGAFSDKNVNVNSIQLWRVSGQYQPLAPLEEQGGEIKVNIAGSKLRETIVNAKALALGLIKAFDDSASFYIAVYPSPLKDYNDYAYLERVAEWEVLGGGDD